MYVVGIIKPSNRPGRAEELAAILPEGIAMEHDQVGINAGTRTELVDAMPIYDAKVERMAKLGVDLVHAAGVPPLLLGYEGEQALVRRWERQFGRPVFTNGQSQVEAARAFKAKRLVAISYFREPAVNRDFARYLEGAGFAVLSSTGMEVDFQAVPRVPPDEVRAFIRACVAPHRDADALYMIGPAWKTLEMLESLEAELGMPVLHHIPAQSWEIQRRSGLRRPVQGYGRLVAELPGLG